MIKIAIMTWTFIGANYGQTLQAFALQESINKCGYSDVLVSGVDTEYGSFFNSSGMEAMKISPQYLFKNSALTLRQKARFFSFDIFVRRHFNYLEGYDKDGMEKSMLKYDVRVVVCGGDQIWNPCYHENKLDMYVAKFEKIKEYETISYAPSVGLKVIPEEKKESFQNGVREINKFKAISVREESGKELLKEAWKEDNLPDRAITVVLDPVFLFAGEEWIDLVRKDHKYIDLSKRDANNIVCYIVGESEEHRYLVEQISKERGQQVRWIEMDEAIETSIDVLPLTGVDPLEFVWEIANADYVIGDSYHAVAFAIIFHKEFALLRRNDRKEWNYQDDGRMEQLYRMFKLGNRYIYTLHDYHLLTQIDYDEIDSILKSERDKSLGYLMQSLYDAMVSLFVKRYFEEDDYYFQFPKEEFRSDEKIIIYGAGAVGYHYFCQCHLFDYAKVVLWVDLRKTHFAEVVVDPADRDYEKIEFDRIIIANNDENQRKEIKEFLMSKKVSKEKIFSRAPIVNKIVKEKSD